MGHTCWSFGRVRVNSPYPKKFNSACKRGCSAPHCYWSQSSVGEQHDGQVLKILQAFETYLNDHFGACRPRFWRLPDHIVGSCWCHIPRYLGKLYKHLSYMQFHGQFIIIFPSFASFAQVNPIVRALFCSWTVLERSWAPASA